MKKLNSLGWEPTEEYGSAEELRAFGQFRHKIGVVLHFFPKVRGYGLKEGIKLSEVMLEGVHIAVCSPEDYVIMRVAVWTEEDKMKALIVARAQAKKLDLAYLKRRAAEENVSERVHWVLERVKKK